MQQGLVVEQGPTAEVFAAPRHEYTPALLEAAPGRTAAFGAACYVGVTRGHSPLMNPAGSPSRRGLS